jgi:hypothetical protein
MAMLVINRVFQETWGSRARECPATEYWRDVIPDVRRDCPDFVFVGETYWDLEWELQQQGMDYCYDKRLYERLVHGDAESIRLHLQADPSFQNRLVRFIENHDELRAAQVFDLSRHRAAAIAGLSLPGAKLLHEGQLEGRKIKLPVQLGRRPAEAPDAGLQAFYDRLLPAVHTLRTKDSAWRLCAVGGWRDNESCRRILAWCWSGGESRHAIVVNFSDQAAQGTVRLPWHELAERRLALTDTFSGEVYRREGGELLNPGLYVDLPPWGFHFFSIAIVR